MSYLKDIEQEYNEYVKGSDVLYWWMKDIERDFDNGKKINKTKYNKIKKLEEERRQKAIELLEGINRGNSRVKTCMPTRTAPPPPPGKQIRGEGDRGE